MITVDTNVLVRLLVRDDEIQAKKAFLALQKEQDIYIPIIILIELVWVLESCYEFSRAKITQILEAILDTQQFSVEKRDLIRRVLDAYSNQKVDFVDSGIAQWVAAANAVPILTFDKAAAAKLPEFKL